MKQVRFQVRQVQEAACSARDVCTNGYALQNTKTVYAGGLYQDYLTIEEARAVVKHNPGPLEIVRITTETIT